MYRAVLTTSAHANGSSIILLEDHCLPFWIPIILLKIFLNIFEMIIGHFSYDHWSSIGFFENAAEKNYELGN